MILENVHKVPKEVVPLLETHTRILTEVLSHKLVGVYLHGSAAMGGFTPEQSDVDYLVVVSEPLSSQERQQLGSSFLEIYGEGAPAKGVEMSIVLDGIAGRGFRYPTPYEFHFGTREQINLHSRPHTDEMVDPDLAAHFVIVKQRGICLYGQPIDEVFAEVPAKYYLASIALDADENFRNIQEKTGTERCQVPAYAVLNFCRVLGYIDDGLITSKLEGGEWAQEKLPERYHPIISAALSEYRQAGSSPLVDPVLLKEFADYSHKQITAGLRVP